MKHVPHAWTDPQPGVTAAEQERWSEQARRWLGRQLVRAAVGVAGGAGLAMAAGLWIGADGDGGGLVVALQLAGLLLGPTLALFALVWMPVLLRRRWAVTHRSWALCPARSATLHWGPFRLTVVRLVLPSGVPNIIFPELVWRSRVRRLIAGDGQLLVLVPRPNKLDTLFYAGAGGSPCFTDQPAMGSGAQSFWERRGAAAIAERGLPAAQAG